MNILTYIDNNYNTLKNHNKILSYKFFGKFNEDIFHNTIYNCILLNNNFSNEDELEKYFWVAFKNNIKRDAMYKYHELLKNDLTDINVVSNDDIEFIHDENLIFNKIHEEFGDILYSLFEEHIAGKSIIKLQSEHLDIKNLKQKIKNIKIYIKNFRDASKHP